ncbi:MAG: Ig-like domain-containing protein [Pyrinomonadaceae bacterium]
MAASGSTLLAATDDGVFISVDNAQNWTAANSGLLSNYVTDFFISGSIIYAATGYGVHVSIDNGQNWTPLDAAGQSDPFTPAVAANYSHVFAGSNGYGVFTKSNIFPRVEITGPAINSSFPAPSNITITASAAADTGKSITQVEFLSNGTLVGSPDTIAPFQVTLGNAAAGTYVLTAKATDSDGGGSHASLPRHSWQTTPAALLPNNDDWNDDNYWSADEPGNDRGNPPGSPQDGGAGSGNFQTAAPSSLLPGRGIDLSLGLAYNSRVWNKAEGGSISEITFDIDKDWPAWMVARLRQAALDGRRRQHAR